MYDDQFETKESKIYLIEMQELLQNTVLYCI